MAFHLIFIYMSTQNQPTHSTPSTIALQPTHSSHKHHGQDKDNHPQQEVQALREKRLPTNQDNNEEEEEEISSYFRMMLTKHDNKQAYSLSQFAKSSVCQEIQNGQVYVAHEHGSLDKILFQSRIKEDKANKKEEEEEKKKAIIDMHLKYLERQLSAGKRSKEKEPEDENQFSDLAHQNVVFSKKQHQQFLAKIIKQKSELSLKKKSVEEKQKSKQEEWQKMRRLSEQQKLQKQREEKKKKIMEKLEEQRKAQEKKAKEEEENNKRLSQLKHKKFLHEKLEERYQTEVLIPSLEEKKKKLKQIREMSKGFKIEDINNHEKEYLRKREQSGSTSQTKRHIEEWHYKLPEKSQRLTKLLEDENLQAKLKLEEKKRKLEEKIQRQQQFVSYLKEKHPPTIDPKLRQEIQQRLRLKSETKEVQKPDRKTLGINYLEEVKSQRKKSANSQMQLERKPVVVEQYEAEQKKSQTNYLKTRRTKQQYEQLREKRIEKLINSDDGNTSDKIIKLQVEANKLIEQQKRKEEKLRLLKNSKSAQEEDTQSTNLLLASIKAKMGIIDLYNKQ